MSHLFDDRAVTAAASVLIPTIDVPEDEREQVRNEAFADARIALNAAVAALPHEGLIEKAARAIHREMYDALDDDPRCATCRATARVALVAVGLIPEQIKEQA